LIKAIIDKDKMGKLLDVKNTWQDLMSWFCTVVDVCENQREAEIKVTKAEMCSLIKKFDVAYEG